MITLITYDITDPKRLTNTRNFLKEFGLRTQKARRNLFLNAILTTSRLRESGHIAGTVSICKVILSGYIKSVIAVCARLCYQDWA